MINFAGGFGGEGFDDDPGDLISWVLNPDQTVLDTFQVSGLSNGISLIFQTAFEFDAANFSLLRSVNPVGPFVEVPGSPLTPIGSSSQGAFYTLEDPGLPAGVTQFYRLEQETAAMDRILLATGSGMPLPMTLGETVVVGPGGFADIDAAIAGSTANQTILVESGTYPPFTLSSPRRIMARQGASVTIDGFLGRSRVENLPAATQVALYGLSFTPAGLDITDCLGSVVLDQVSITNGMAGTALLVGNSPQVKVQDCDFAGTTAIQLTGNSIVHLARGQQTGVIDVDDTATFQHVQSGIDPLDIQTELGASNVAFAGISPRMEIPQTIPLGANIPVTVTGAPLAPWILFVANNRSWFDLTSIGFPIENALLLDLGGNFRQFRTGTVQPNGSSTANIGVLEDINLIGLSAPLQVFSVNPGTGRFVLGNLRDVIFLP